MKKLCFRCVYSVKNWAFCVEFSFFILILKVLSKMVIITIAKKAGKELWNET